MVAPAARRDHCGMPSSTGSLRVFLADDSAAIRQRVASMLGEESVTIVGEGTSPSTCIAGILASRPDVVVLDVQLDGGTGLQVLKAVRSADPGVAFVVFSNNSAPAYRKRYLGEGAAQFLDKSADFTQLAAAVASACARVH